MSAQAAPASEAAPLAETISSHTDTSVAQTQVVDPIEANKILNKYQEERSKRLREDGQAQYVQDLSQHPKFKHFADDPFGDSTTPGLKLANGSHHKFLILGAGFGGLLYAVRLLDAGFKAEDIVITDSAGGFGGTWYWNRYPGLMCDVESYIYLPLLEETGFMPKNKYSYGYEIKKYANIIAEKYNLVDRGAFRVTIKKQTWDEENKQWSVELSQQKSAEEAEEYMKLSADFVFSAAGLLNYPKIPDMPGMEKFEGHCFHTSRWDYKYTGGSPEDPTLHNLQGKRVGIIGTGATAIQLVPQLAKWAKELYVFQRTPSAVDVRGQRETDPEWWAKMTAKKGWQRERSENFNAFIMNDPNKPEVDMVSDGWTKAPTYSALIGGPPPKRNPEEIGAHVTKLNAMDLARQQRIRDRVDQIVKDKTTADNLKPWYPTWCKRPCFHDDYLPAFNLPHVKLVDTGGKGVDSVNEKGVVVSGKEYEVDVLVLSTGYFLPSHSTPAARASMEVIGRDGKNLNDAWKNGVSTLHGVVTRGFPNFFFNGPSQATASANFMYVLDQLATHAVFMVSEALKNNKKPVVEPTAQAEEEWAMQILSQVGGFAAISGCTPSYLNREGESDKVSSMAEKMMSARGGIWGAGVASYIETIEAWRTAKDLRGLEIQSY